MCVPIDLDSLCFPFMGIKAKPLRKDASHSTSDKAAHTNFFDELEDDTFLADKRKKIDDLLTESMHKNSFSKRLELDIRSIPQLQSYFANPDVRIFFIGALDKDDYLNGNVESVTTTLDNVLHLREQLYRHILESSQGCNLVSLIKPV